MATATLRSPRRATRRRIGAPSEALGARLAFGLVGLYLLDDAFIHLEPGVSAGDHLLSGTVPVLVLAGLAWAYPHVRAGARAGIALTVGLGAVAVGLAIPLRHIGIEGPSGDDFTGVLATVGGAALAALGARALWRSRRLDERLARRYLRRAGIGVAALVVAFEFVVPVPFAFIATHRAREPVKAADLGRPYERVSFETADGLTLRGWYVPSKNGAAVIAFPGRKSPVRHARMLARHGYGVLLFDRRGDGESDGDPNRLGYGGTHDVFAAIAFLETRPDVDRERLGILGLSVGGELALEVAARTRALKAVVSEGAGIRSYREQLDMPDAGRWTSLPFWATTTAATVVFGNEGVPPNLTELTPRIAPRALFLIWTPEEAGEELNEPYFEAAGRPKATWAIAEAAHTGGLTARPAEYERRVVGFYDRVLLGERR